MIVSNTVVTKFVLVPLEVAAPTPGISPGTGGALVPPDVEPTAADPTPGISPANAVPERAHASINAMSIRFISLSPF